MVGDVPVRSEGPPLTDRDRWVSIAEAADQVSVSQSSVRRYIRAGEVTLLRGRVKVGAVQDAEAAARQRKSANLKSGGARGKWLAERAEAFIAAHNGLDEVGRGIVRDFAAYARA